MFQRDFRPETPTSVPPGHEAGLLSTTSLTKSRASAKCRSDQVTLAEPTVESRASASASLLPSVSSELVHSHRLARATTALASHCESELGRHAARRFVLSLVNVRGDAVGFGPTP